jgi:hypothetical protein
MGFDCTLVRNTEKMRPFQRPRHKWENNIKINLKGVGYEGVGCIHLAQDRDL